MDSQPPNDPNNNRNNQASRKVVPFDGRSGRNARSGEGDAPMDIMGDMREAPAAVVMFLVGVAAWFLRERCIC
eukprot:CAMPEP_0176186212 /NCGR_PEP_ID=MMETSP0121_2-20121125/1752_1 /TAXON_ID=160619 /ORGANISM="Kryptoperidinium foliaceum, Strain CCMP 1326" /LENGTH=72 /DNA_ID=CAMNT_0017524687 /DNA_START=125 /DNA_END=343 /DNA_ORIENTATION=-